MHQARAFFIAEAERIQHAIHMPRNPRPALHRQALGLINRDHGRIAVDHHAFKRGCIPVRYRAGAERLGGGFGQGGDAQLLAGLEPRICFDARPIQADLPSAQHFLQRPLGQVREVPMEPAIKPNIGLCRGNGT
jgi:hypothetical protein